MGIFSSVAVDCTSLNAAPKYTDLSYFSRLVEEAFTAADAGSPWTTPDGGEGGAGGATSEPAPAGAPSTGGEAPSPPPTPAEEPRAEESGCSYRTYAPTEHGAWLALLALGAALSRRVGARRRT